MIRVRIFHNGAVRYETQACPKAIIRAIQYANLRFWNINTPDRFVLVADCGNISKILWRNKWR